MLESSVGLPEQVGGRGRRMKLAESEISSGALALFLSPMLHICMGDAFDERPPHWRVVVRVALLDQARGSLEVMTSRDAHSSIVDGHAEQAVQRIDVHPLHRARRRQHRCQSCPLQLGEGSGNRPHC